jgi:hypothetical protein
MDFDSPRSHKHESGGRNVTPLEHIILILSQTVFALSYMYVSHVLFFFILFVDWRFSSGTPVSSTNKTDRHDIHVAEILLKVALNTKIQNQIKIIVLFIPTSSNTLVV